MNFSTDALPSRALSEHEAEGLFQKTTGRLLPFIRRDRPDETTFVSVIYHRLDGIAITLMYNPVPKEWEHIERNQVSDVGEQSADLIADYMEHYYADEELAEMEAATDYIDRFESVAKEEWLDQ